MSDGLLLSFFGDDFTGSTDSLEALALNGVRAVLFLEPPTPALLAERFPDLQAVGVAGVSRSWTPAQMEAGLRPLFVQLQALGAPLTHYKVCSTFDSSPEIGSIGRALDIGQAVFDGPFVPLLVGAPVLRRYTLFGNQFATVGDETFRLDRHPTMSRHPVTPMDEGDLRLHLARQTKRSIALFDILHQTGCQEQVDQRFAALMANKHEIVLFDVLDDERLAEAGRLIWQQRRAGRSFVVGSSGVEYALVAHWGKSGLLSEPRSITPPGAVDQILVAAGSCSPETERQIGWAVANGFAEIALDTVRLAAPDTAEGERIAVIRRAEALIGAGRSVILHTSRGPHDPRIAATADVVRCSGLPRERMSELLGGQLGMITRTLLERTGLRRVVIAGGDTSGHVTQQLGIFALELLAPAAPGSPLCRAHAHDPAFDGLQIALKGGQVGKQDFFGTIRGK